MREMWLTVTEVRFVIILHTLLKPVSLFSCPFAGISHCVSVESTIKIVIL